MRGGTVFKKKKKKKNGKNNTRGEEKNVKKTKTIFIKQPPPVCNPLIPDSYSLIPQWSAATWQHTSLRLLENMKILKIHSASPHPTKKKKKRRKISIEDIEIYLPFYGGEHGKKEEKSFKKKSHTSINLLLQ